VYIRYTPQKTRVETMSSISKRGVRNLSLFALLAAPVACAKASYSYSFEEESESTDSTGGTSGDPPPAPGGSESSAGTRDGGGGQSSGTGGKNGTAAGGRTGKGGAGAGGRSGTGGRSGAGGRGGAVGSGGRGSSSSAGSPGSAAGSSGCASLSVPLTAMADQAHFVITLANSASFSGATLTMRVYVKAGTGGTISNYVQDSSYKLLRNSKPTKLSVAGAWQTLTWNVATEALGTSGIALTSISRIGIEIRATPDTAWSNPTIVYVDSISVNSPKLSFAFGASSTVAATPATLDVAGQVLWQNSNAVDTTASRAVLSWLASCP